MWNIDVECIKYHKRHHTSTKQNYNPDPKANSNPYLNLNPNHNANAIPILHLHNANYVKLQKILLLLQQ